MGLEPSAVRRLSALAAGFAARWFLARARWAGGANVGNEASSLPHEIAAKHTLELRGIPPGASVKVDGMEVMRPMTLSRSMTVEHLAAGRHILSVTEPDDGTRYWFVDLTGDAALSLYSPGEQLGYAALYLRTTGFWSWVLLVAGLWWVSRIVEPRAGPDAAGMAQAEVVIGAIIISNDRIRSRLPLLQSWRKVLVLVAWGWYVGGLVLLLSGLATGGAGLTLTGAAAFALPAAMSRAMGLRPRARMSTSTDGTSIAWTFLVAALGLTTMLVIGAAVSQLPDVVEFGRPSGIAVDQIGNVYVADQQSGDVYKISPSGQIIRRWATKLAIFGLAVDSVGNVYVSGLGLVGLLQTSGDPIYIIQESGPDAPPYTGIAIGADESIWVAVPRAGSVKHFSSRGVNVRNVALRWNGQPAEPAAIAVGPPGDIYVLDARGNRVSRLNAAGDLLDQGHFDSVSAKCWSIVKGIAVDAQGYVHLSDPCDNRVVILSPELGPVGWWGNGGAGGGLGSGSFDGVGGIGVDRDRSMVYVADTENRRIQIFSSENHLSGGVMGRWGGKYARMLDVICWGLGDRFYC